MASRHALNVLELGFKMSVVKGQKRLRAWGKNKTFKNCSSYRENDSHTIKMLSRVEFVASLEYARWSPEPSLYRVLFSHGSVILVECLPPSQIIATKQKTFQFLNVHSAKAKVKL